MTTELLAGKYRIVREIARSNDVVYEAVDTAMGRRVAIKELLIPPNLTGAARRERIERFNREARAAGRLSHPNIVTVFDFGEDSGRYYIVMEFLEGQSLRDRLDSAGALPVHEAVDIARQILSALAHAHAQDVIHRDVKPDNVHIQPDGHIKLTDFGIARLTSESSLTADGQVFGTPSYMSPEQIEGKHIDCRSDLFSMAVVLYEMLTGRKPFTGDSVITITYAIMNADPAPMFGVPYALERVVLQGLAKNPSLRFQSAEAMRDAITQAMAAPAFSQTSTMQPPALFGPFQQAPGVPRAPSPWQTANPAPGVPPNVPPAPTAMVPSMPPPVYPQKPPAAPAGTVFAGPFATWGQPAGTPVQPQQPPPAVYTVRSGPLVSDSVKTFFSVMAISFVLAGIILGGVLLFVRSYEEHKRTGALMALQSLLSQADRMVLAGDLKGAARLYEEALRSAPDTVAGMAARTSLAEVWNRLGVQAAQTGRYSEAVSCFQLVLELYTRYPGNLSYDDIRRQQLAADNLEAVRSRLRSGPDGGLAPSVGGHVSEPAGPDLGAAAIRDRTERAAELLREGDAALQNGDLERARDLWTDAASTAPGTDPAREAQYRLQQHMPAPHF